MFFGNQNTTNNHITHTLILTILLHFLNNQINPKWRKKKKETRSLHSTRIDCKRREENKFSTQQQKKKKSRHDLN